MATVVGTDTNNWLSGTSSADVIKGFGGDDTLKGGGGADQLYGGTGIDSAIYADSSTGVTVNLAQGYGRYGTAEGDSLFSIENVYGSGYHDQLTGNGGTNRLYGLDGYDTLNGGGGSDILDGGYGDDLLEGGTGADVLIGGMGNHDTAMYWNAPGGVYVSLGDNLGIGNEAQGDTFSGIEGIYGSLYADFLIGDHGANNLSGSSGTDTLYGLDGADRLHGGLDADVMVGGNGDDTYVVDHPDDRVMEAPGQGIDTVIVEVETNYVLTSYVLTAGADIEYVTTSFALGTEPVNITGNSSGNVITGNYGNNVINGGDGNDELTGLAGQDSFLFNTPLSEAVNIDVITDFNVADDTILLERDIFSSGLGLGNISPGEFVIGTAARDGNDRIIYDSNTGALYYDRDSVGGNAAVQFAELSPGLALTYLDFYVV